MSISQSAPTAGQDSMGLLEMKKQAKRLGKAQPELQHTQCLQTTAQKAGFQDWQQAHRVLSGDAHPGDDFGTMWHSRSAGGFLNEWFARYSEARSSWEQQERTFLLPYKTQFLIVGDHFLRNLGLGDDLLSTGLDLVGQSKADPCQRATKQRLRALLQSE